jgi:hypothetical protein
MLHTLNEVLQQSELRQYFLSYRITYKKSRNEAAKKKTKVVMITAWSGVLEKITVAQLIKKLPAFYGNRKCITVFTRAPPSSLF